MKAKWTILVAEDNENDFLILDYAFATLRNEISLKVVRDGEEAVDYISGRHGFQDRNQYPFPDLVLLDLKMPKLDGFSVLRWLRSHPPLCRLRVIVFSSSNQRTDVDLAYDLGASSFYRKPTAFHEMKEIVNGMKQWFELNQFSVLSDVTLGDSKEEN